MSRTVLAPFLVLVAAPLVAAASALDVLAQWQAGHRPDQSAYAACVFLVGSLQGFYAAVLAVMAGYTLARSLAGRLDGVRRATFDNVMLLWHFAVVQGLVGLTLVTLFPRLVGS